MTEPDQVLAHLHRQGALGPPARPADPVPLFGGVADVALDRDGGLTAGGRRLHGRARHLSDLLTAGGRRPLFLADRPAVEAAVRDRHDPLLYRAVRDVFPPRPDAGAAVRADLVVYEPGTLPGGEPHRSLGHWNPPGQLEIFQVLTGRVAMLVAGGTTSGRRRAYLQVCGPGETAAVPLGAWHVSYVLDGPAAVFNVYADRHETGHLPHDDKYQRAAPVEVTVRRAGDDLEPAGPPGALRRWGGLGPVPAAAWLDGWLPDGVTLAGRHLRAPAGAWDALMQRLLDATARGWAGPAGRPGTTPAEGGRS